MCIVASGQSQKSIFSSELLESFAALDCVGSDARDLLRASGEAGQVIRSCLQLQLDITLKISQETTMLFTSLTTLTYSIMFLHISPNSIAR